MVPYSVLSLFTAAIYLSISFYFSYYLISVIESVISSSLYWSSCLLMAAYPSLSFNYSLLFKTALSLVLTSAIEALILLIRSFSFYSISYFSAIILTSKSPLYKSKTSLIIWFGGIYVDLLVVTSTWYL